MGADRTRRLLGFLGLLSLCALQALWPHPGVENWGRWLTRPWSVALRPMATWLQGAELTAASHSRPILPPLAEIERQLGTPPAVAGVAWLEAPVLLQEDVRFQIAGGHSQGFFPGLAVVFGQQYLGRIEEVDVDHAWVSLATAADRRTGLALIGKDGAPLSALAIGRGAKAPPVLAYVAARTEPAPDAAVLWRPRYEEPPALGLAGFEVGVVRERGARSRGDFHRTLELQLPLGVGGRVWVAMGAVPASVPHSPDAHTAAAWPGLRLDAVYGDAVASAKAATRHSWGAVLSEGRVAGLVIAQDGRLLWVLRPGPSLLADGVAWDPASQELLPTKDANPHAFYYTERWRSAPRGLPLGKRDEAAVPWAGSLEVVAR